MRWRNALGISVLLASFAQPAWAQGIDPFTYDWLEGSCDMYESKDLVPRKTLWNGSGVVLLEETDMPAIILEVGHIDNDEDSEQILEPCYALSLVKRTVDAILDWSQQTGYDLDGVVGPDGHGHGTGEKGVVNERTGVTEEQISHFYQQLFENEFRSRGVAFYPLHFSGHQEGRWDYKERVGGFVEMANLLGDNKSLIVLDTHADSQPSRPRQSFAPRALYYHRSDGSRLSRRSAVLAHIIDRYVEPVYCGANPDSCRSAIVAQSGGN